MRTLTAIVLLIILVNATCSAFVQSAASSKSMSLEEIKAFLGTAKAEKRQVTVKVEYKTTGGIIRRTYRGKVTGINEVYLSLDDGGWLHATHNDVAWANIISVGNRNPVQKTLQISARTIRSIPEAVIIYPLLWLTMR